MKVSLVSISDPSVLGSSDIKTAEDLIVYIARVSSPGNQLNLDTAPKLLKYLIDHQHWSPFDMVNMCVEVTTSKAVSIQILRHWSIKPQEFSQRYAEVTEIEPIQLRRQATTNRQSSSEEFDPVIFTDMGWFRSSTLVEKAMIDIKALYHKLIKEGVAKECARMILPMATSTTIYLNGSVRSWIHYLQQRLDEHAQLEHRQVAAEIKDLFVDQFPNLALSLNYAKTL